MFTYILTTKHNHTTRIPQVYHLSDARCLEYRPNDQTAKMERPLSKPEALPALHLPSHLLLLDPAAAKAKAKAGAAGKGKGKGKKRPRAGSKDYDGDGEEEEEEASVVSNTGGGGENGENEDPQATLRLLARQHSEFRRLMRQSPDDFRLAPVKRRASCGGGRGRGGGRGGRGGRGRGGGGGRGGGWRKPKEYEGESDSADEGTAGSSSSSEGED
jgi:hypothetical protein